MKILFIGATHTVTGSKHLITHENQDFLIDCGLFQGYRTLRDRNWTPLPLNIKRLKGVLLTHAHIDHSGYIPLLIKQGFRGPIYATPATIDLCHILLPDSGYLQEEDARRANRYGYTKHQPALPLYTKEEAEESLQHFKPVEFGNTFHIADELTATYHRAGHILGASMVELKDTSQRIVFSGDLGRPHDIVMKPPTQIQQTDYLVLEATYGDRLHGDTSPADHLADIILTTLKRGGSVIVPAFAVGRAQTLLYLIHQLKEAQRIPDIPIYLDSPMAIDATELLMRYPHEHRLDTQYCTYACHGATYIRTTEESKQIMGLPFPKVIISASGMATGGRILHHIKSYGPDPRNTILMTGFQASGTRGDLLLKGRPSIKIHGEDIPIRAQVVSLENVSAHADYKETIAWLKHFQHPPRQVFLTHGEPEALESLKNHIHTELGWSCIIPGYEESFDLQ